MDHNNFDFYDDLTQPILNFMIKLKISTAMDTDLKEKNKLKFEKELYKIPDEFRQENLGEKVN